MQVFAVSGALERAEARYAWLRKRLKSRSSVWALFPPGWRLPQQVALSFCSITRAQLAEALDSKVWPPALLHCCNILPKVLPCSMTQHMCICKGSLPCNLHVPTSI